MQFQEEQDYTKRFDAGIWVHLLKYAKPFYKHLFVVAAMMLVCAGMDVVFPLLTREAIDVYIANGQTEGLGWFVLKYASGRADPGGGDLRLFLPRRARGGGHVPPHPQAGL